MQEMQKLSAAGRLGATAAKGENDPVKRGPMYRSSKPELDLSGFLGGATLATLAGAYTLRELR